MRGEGVIYKTWDFRGGFRGMIFSFQCFQFFSFGWLNFDRDCGDGGGGLREGKWEGIDDMRGVVG